MTWYEFHSEYKWLSHDDMAAIKQLQGTSVEIHRIGDPLRKDAFIGKQIDSQYIVIHLRRIGNCLRVMDAHIISEGGNP